MKIITPIKFIIGIIVLFLILMPILFFGILVFLDELSIRPIDNPPPYYWIILFEVLGQLIAFRIISDKEYCKVIFKDGTLCNYVLDGTRNNGWCEELSNVQRVELVDKHEIQKYYKQFNKSKAILIDFGNYNVKYIYAGLFSKMQIQNIIRLTKEGAASRLER